jgi:hypothetical protein
MRAGCEGNVSTWMESSAARWEAQLNPRCASDIILSLFAI